MPQPSPVATAATVEANLNRVPLATYRIQLRPELGLDQVRQLLPYLQALGISDVYLSPLFHAREESAHGYDVVDHTKIEPAFGDLEAFQHLAEDIRGRQMGLLLDVIPNHMGINDPDNRWWHDVLENGEASRFARYFDIDWEPKASRMTGKVLLPFLGKPFGEVLEQGELQVVFEDYRLQLTYGPRRFPLTPSSWPIVLEGMYDCWKAAQTAEAGNSQAQAAPAGSGFSESGLAGGAAPARRVIVAATDGSTAMALRTDWEVSEEAELRSIVTQLRQLPTSDHRDPESTQQRYREQRVARRRLRDLLQRCPAMQTALDEAITQINGQPGDPRSFDRLEQLLAQQHYRLAFWRVAAEEINYRRFFDINDLAAIRVEDREVFDAVHQLVAMFLERGWVTGLRVDHPDGLLDPQAYFENLQTLFRRYGNHNGPNDDGHRQLYVVAEKILSGDEPLPEDWPVCGTTGYELLNLLNRLLVDGEGVNKLRAAYGRLTDQVLSPRDVLYDSKRAVLLSAMASELHMLAAQIYRIAQPLRSARDFTLGGLQRALREVIACMAVYRTYLRPRGWDVSETDYRRVTLAVRMAKRRNPTMAWGVFDFIASVLLLQYPPGLSEEQAAEWREFALKVQQVSGPVMAKGLEDTAFYRYYPLASLNEVGAELDTPAITPEEMHRQMHHRMVTWPHSLSATGTHDTKRGEDLRARLHVLSEMPEDWCDTVLHWQQLHRPLLQTLDGEALPDRNALYLFYQTVVGTWPVAGTAAATGSMTSDAPRQSPPLGDNGQANEEAETIAPGQPLQGALPGEEPAKLQLTDNYVERIQQYLLKALREGKVYTSWMNPWEAYEQVVTDFVRQVLTTEAGERFRDEVDGLVKSITPDAFVNSLSQMLLKAMLPGVPDIYQGTEWWDFNLVDPDNRRPVDFAARHAMLTDLQAEFAADPRRLIKRLIERWPADEIKLFTLWRTLQVRQEYGDLVTYGEYVPLEIDGVHRDHIFAFARRLGDQWLVVAVPRLTHMLRLQDRAAMVVPGMLKVNWQSTNIILPERAPADWISAWDQKAIHASTMDAGRAALRVTDLLFEMPVALLIPPN